MAAPIWKNIEKFVFTLNIENCTFPVHPEAISCSWEQRINKIWRYNWELVTGNKEMPKVAFTKCMLMWTCHMTKLLKK